MQRLHSKTTTTADFETYKIEDSNTVFLSLNVVVVFVIVIIIVFVDVIWL